MESMRSLKVDNVSAHGFKDELLLALERSGKTLVEIQRNILPWGNEKSEEMVTADGMLYSNDDKGFSNRTQKRIRIRELLDATFAAKAQDDADLLEMTRNLKRATEEKKSYDLRYKYLTGVAKKEFGVTKSNKRKVVPESLKSAVLGNIHDFRPKKERLGDFGGDDEEEFPGKEELPEKEDFSNEIKLEEPRGNHLKKSEAGSINRDWKGAPIKQESPSSSVVLTPPVYFPMKMEVSVESSLFPQFRSMSKNGAFQPRRAMSRSPGSAGVTNFQGARSFLRGKDDIHLQRFEDKSSPAHSSSCGSFELYGSRTSSPKPHRIFTDIPETLSRNYARPKTAPLDTNNVYRSSSAPISGTSGGSRVGDASDESDKATLNITRSGSTPTKSPRHESAKVQYPPDSMKDSDSANTESLDVDLAALRMHKRSVERDFLNENQNASSRASEGKVFDSDESDEEPRTAARRKRVRRCYSPHEEEEAHLPAVPTRHERFVARWDGGFSENSASDSDNEIFDVSNQSGEDASDSFVAGDGDVGDSDASNSFMEELIEISSDDESV